MSKTLVLTPAKPANPVIIANGRTYAAIPPGLAQTVESSDSDVLTSNGFTRIGYTGATSERPPVTSNAAYRATVGMVYFDTTLTAPVVFDGVSWRNPFTGAIA